MKTIGLIGGTTWHSTIDYYKLINLKVNEMAGGVNSAKILLYSINFDDLFKLMTENNFAKASSMFCDIAKNLESAGADCIVLCANTAHLFADDVRKAVKIPLIHIGEATAKEIHNNNIGKVGLLGTKITMEEDFIKNILARHNIEVLIPGTDDSEFIHDTIFNELGKGILSRNTKAKYIQIINKLIQQGANGIILGCTEIPLLIKQEDCSVKTFDTTMIHANAAVEFAMKD